MSIPSNNQQCPVTEVDAMSYERFSPRSFRSDRIPVYEKTLVEAARRAPSCYNEPSRLFLCAITEKDCDLFLQPLVDKNRRWAKKASLLLYLCTKFKYAQTRASNKV